jgi:hypothetical protein
MHIPHLLVDVLRVYLPTRLADTIEELERWWDEQRRKEEDVQERLINPDNPDDRTPEWGRRPVTKDYCGALPTKPRVTDLVVESDNSCTDQNPGPRPRRSCYECRFNVLPHDPLERLYQSALSKADLELVKQAESFTEAVARSEIVEAVKAHGLLRIQPKVLPWCERLSKEDTHVVGPILNWTLACGYWDASQS